MNRSYSDIMWINVIARARSQAQSRADEYKWMIKCGTTGIQASRWIREQPRVIKENESNDEDFVITAIWTKVQPWTKVNVPNIFVLPTLEAIRGHRCSSKLTVSVLLHPQSFSLIWWFFGSQLDSSFLAKISGQNCWIFSHFLLVLIRRKMN